MINSWLGALGETMEQSAWFAPLIAVSAGVLTSFTPCSLSSVPLVIGYVGGYAGDCPKKAFGYSLVFCIGMSATLTVLGTLASILGRLIRGTGSWWYLVLGGLMMLMALQTWGVVSVIPSTNALSKSTSRGYIGAGLAGLLGGLFASPCATPVLVVLLAMVAEQGRVLWGIFLLLLYSLGHSVLLLIAGTSVGLVKRLSSSRRYRRYTRVFEGAMGGIIAILALYMFYLGF